MNRPKISVLIPTYNYARFLPEAIESVLAQDFTDFELLIIDDCSTDDTARVVKPFCEKDSRVQFSVNPTNIGMVDNWNLCMARARGDYIKFLFGDDKLCQPTALSKMLALLNQNPSAVLAASARMIMDEQSNVVDVYRDLPDGCHKREEVVTAYLMNRGKNLIGEPSVVLFRKEDAKRGFNRNYRQIVDVEMWFHLMEKGDVVYTGEPLCAFRCHDRQQTEVNSVSGVAWRESALFFSGCALEPWLPRKVVFPILYWLRQAHKNNPDVFTPDLQEREKQLAQRWGTGWFGAYCIYLLWYRITKPFQNLNHSIQKRLARKHWAARK